MIHTMDFLDLMYKPETLFSGETIDKTEDGEVYLCHHMGKTYGAVVPDEVWRKYSKESITFLVNFCNRWGKR